VEGIGGAYEEHSYARVAARQPVSGSKSETSGITKSIRNGIKPLVRA
jgi:hypothetical protein